MVACCPSPGAPTYEYGAHKKGNWPQDHEHNMFVSPLDPGCEQRFRYGKHGTIKPESIDDQAAIQTIEHLALDHEFLIKERRKVIFEFLNVNDVAKRKKLLAAFEDKDAAILPQFAMQCSQVLRREWGI